VLLFLVKVGANMSDTFLLRPPPFQKTEKENSDTLFDNFLENIKKQPKKSVILMKSIPQ